MVNFIGKTVKYKNDSYGELSSIEIISAPNNGSIEKICVPINEDNTDYQAILKWVADGNTIEEAD